MTKQEIDLISSKGKGVYGQLYYDQYGHAYVGLKNGRIGRYIPGEMSETTVQNTVLQTVQTYNSGTSSISTTMISTGTDFNLMLMGG